MPECQLLFVEEYDDGLVLDLVAMEPVETGGEVLPAGNPIPLGVAVSEPGARADAASTLGRWARGAGVVTLETEENRGAIRFLLSHDDELVLFVQRK
jgi:hypothetical protein